MEIGTVSTLALAGMGFTAVLCFLLPIGPCIYMKAVKKARLGTFFLGCITFVFSAMVLEPILHNVVLGTTGTLLMDNLPLYAIYGGLAAALFEETGRYIAMKKLLKAPKAIDGIMYGIGHGGIEALLIGGIGAVCNLLSAIMINSGAIEASLAALDDAARETTLATLSQMWTLPGGVFFLSGVERLIAVALHVALSVIMYRGVMAGSKKHVAIAYLLHFAVDACTVIAAKLIPIALMELLLLVAVLLIWWLLALPAYRQSVKEKL